MNTKANQISFTFDVIETELFLEGDLQNIRNMLPKLYDHQHEDVQRAEERFKDGKGYLFTNGTGTGKTFVGLGIAKRFYAQNKRNILFVVPTETKALDWISEGRIVGLEIYKITDINDKGFDASVTTYANFYQNEKINERVFDLIIYDESHYLNQNAQGKDTVYLDKHKKVARLPSHAMELARDLAGYYPDNYEEPEYHKKIRIWKERRKEEAKKIVEKTKVVFLSATPFAYHKSIEYADGCLFDIIETLEDDEEQGNSYNHAKGFDAFLQEHFGYRMRYNKITIPESGVDQNLLERNFFEKHVEKGVMSTRILELDYDYSRDFITVDSDIGEKINKGMEMFHYADIKDKYKYLSRLVSRKYNYLFVNQLLECIKAQEIHTRIQEHIDLGRKVVVFHSYNNSTIKHPFHFDAEDLTLASDKYLVGALGKEIIEFENDFPELVNLDLSNLKNTRQAIKDKFPFAKEFNGTVSKKKRKENIEEFNADYTRCNVLIVQTKAGREGISLHDKTGVQQRVLITLGLPIAPTEAIQTEGRIYRAGVKSNAIYEYVTVQTNFEKMAFAIKIAMRSKTAENLAMGNYARDLETAFKEGYISSGFDPPNYNQGIGGKESDRLIQTISEFEKAKTYYWSRAKKNSRNKSAEGVDYYATPEPLGYKMVEWLKPQPNDRGLEPSAGHGAIARWFPSDTRNTFIEPSFSLAAELEINTNGNVQIERFEDTYAGVKFQFIAMNPPFGVGGKTAIEHISKAVKQLSYKHSRLLAIIPMGASMDKRLEKYYEDPDESYFHNYRETGQILLPACLFERAGTKVFCRIIRIETDNSDTQFNYRSHDLTYCENINQFFDVIEELEF